MEPKNLATSLHNNTSMEKADSDEMTVIVDATNQHLVPTSGMTVFNQQEKKIFTVDNNSPLQSPTFSTPPACLTACLPGCAVTMVGKYKCFLS